DVSHITDMSYMFKEATSFNSPLLWGSKVSNVTNMEHIFEGATSFNQDITGWDVSSVTKMNDMFNGATLFNQPIGLWGSKTANVGNYSGIFYKASSFDQNLGTWTMKSGCYGDAIFERSGMGCENYSATFVGWAAQTAFIPTGHFYAGQNCLLPLNVAGMAAHKELVRRGAYDMDVHYLAPDCKEDFYETTWSVPNTNTYRDTLTINAIGTNFTVLWEAIDSTQSPPAYTAGIDTAANASPGHPYTLQRNAWNKANVPGTVKVKVFAGNGTLTGLYMLGAHSGALLSVDHWGNNKWQRLDSAFAGCERMELKATDAPDLSEVTGASGLDGMFGLCGNMTDVHDKIGTWDVSKIKSMKGMFHTAGRFNRNINSWNVSAVTNMSGMFNNAYSFNQPLADWDVSKVTNMSGMFSHAAKFNQPIGGWDVSKVTDMRSMFDGAAAFNRPLNDWNVSKVTSMHTMFNGATAFNQPLDRWDVRKSTSMGAMFYGATAFNQPLDNWKPFASTMMGEMFGHSGMSCENYSSTLYSWAQNVDSLKPNVYMTLQNNMKYGRIGKYARELIASKKNWQFGGDTFDFSCSVIGKVLPSDFVTEWDMSIQYTTGTATSLRTSLYGLHFVVEYININDPTDKGIDTNVMASNISPYTITGLNPTGKYRVIAYKNPNIAGSTFGTLVEASDLRRLRKVTQWGTNRWSTMRHAFLMCANLDVTATDVPDLTNVTNMSLMFAMCDSLVYNSSIKDWDVSNVTDMQAMFQDDIKFNQPLSNWDTRNVTDMQHMFHGAHSFDQPLDNFRIDAITAMAYMFDDCGMGCENLSSTLDSWKTQAAALNKNSINLSPFGTTQYYNQTGQAAITALQARGWTITGGTYAANCITPTSWFTTVWDMSKPTYRTNDNPASTIAFTGIGSNYRLDWEDVDDPTNPAKHGTVTVTSSSAASPYYLAVPSGTTKVRIKVHKDSGTFDGYGSNKDFDRLIAIEQWGTTKWASLASSFSGCKNMDVTATDKPDLTGATQIDLSLMFQGCNSLTNSNGSMANWNTERVVKMQQMFAVSSFNVAIGGWNTSNVTSMGQMFSNDTVFNQPLNWNTEKVTDMGGMFFEAKAFNQPFGSNWKTHNVTIMSSMFMRATAFNQDISSWDTRKVIDMRSMFYQAYSFNQPLDSIKINSVSASGMNNMIYLSGINCENLSTTFASWATQATALGKNNVNLGDLSAIQLYNEAGLAAKNILKNTLNWTIHGGRLARGCVSPDSYVSEWDMSKTGAHPTELTTNLWGSGFVVEWVNTADDTDRGTISPATATTAPLTITGLTAGKRYRVIAYTTPLITGSILKKLATEDGGGVTRTDVARLDSVTQWGANKWMSLEGAFRHCSRMDVTATDKPDLTMLSGNKSLNFMFEGCENLVYNSTINNWVTTGVTDMSGMFSGAKAFNQQLDGWDVSNVKYMS
ncbi:MAG: BspA family leucine-rich repeat surface protein, partial [Bacteroidetes bacterium]|nr:BspA family leucine-rich repeat surface protein [Bacteroidota bacterium]